MKPNQLAFTDHGNSKVRNSYTQNKNRKVYSSHEVQFPNSCFAIYDFPLPVVMNRDSSVGIGTGYGLGDRIGVRGLGIFLFDTASRTAPGPTHLVSNGYRGLFPWGVRQRGREADHTPPSSAQVKECVKLYLHSPNTSS
jgi:hypothetical protein